MGEAYNAIWNVGHAAWPAVAAAASWLVGKLNGSFLSALFGALGGSSSAYWLGVRNDRRNKLREEMAATNNAIGLTMNILNMMLSLKRQYVKPIGDRYREQFAEYFAVFIDPNPPPGPIGFVVQTNFQILAMPHTMIDTLARTIIDRIPRSPAAQMLIGSLQRVLAALTRTLELRTQLIGQMQGVPQPVQMMRYFGLPDGAGNQDDTFPDTLTAMTVHVDEAIYYCELVMEILGKHGEALREAYGRRAPKIMTWDLTDPRVAPLMPDRSQYPDFERQFRSPEKPGRWARIRAWVSRRFII